MTQNRHQLDHNSLILPERAKRHALASNDEIDEDELTESVAQLALVLDLSLQDFLAGRPAGRIVDNLAARLHRIRRRVSAAVWQQLIPRAQSHRVAEFLLQDPFTKWSFDKPRGYSGDATLLDIYYKHHSIEGMVQSATPLGAAIYDYTSEAPSSVAGRERRDLLARYVDETVEEVDGAEILALACGHLREAEIAEAPSSARLKRWVAMDQDPSSVATVAGQWAGTAIEPVEGAVRGILRDSYDIGKFDYVYAAGLYDYLPRRVAIALTKALLGMLKSRGRFLFANFSDEITTDGYMETFMDWNLILRSDNDMWDVINASIDRNRYESSVFYGDNRNVVYGVVRRTD